MLFVCLLLQLDTKKSPLALLAQTCNSIGKDSPSRASTDKEESKDTKDAQDKSPTSTTTFTKKRSGSGSPGLDLRRDICRSTSPHSPRSDADLARDFSTPPPTDTGDLGSRPSSASERKRDDKRPGGRDPRDPRESGSGGDPREAGSRPVSRDVTHSPALSTSSSSSAHTGHHSNSKISLSCGNVMLEVNHRESTSRGGTAGTSRPTSQPPSSSTTSSSLTTSSPSHSNHTSPSVSSLHRPEVSTLAPSVSLPSSTLPYPASSLSLLGHHHSYPYGLDSSLYQAGLSHKAGMAQLAASASSSPYLAYASVKTSTGATTLVPVCKDPYCHHCQMSALRGGGGSGHPGPGCGAGCVQCTHDKALSHAAAAAGFSASGLGGLGALGGAHSLPHHLASSLYPHGYGGVIPGHHTVPYVCNWVAGSEHCGKRFTTSEELLQHLRTHTGPGTVESPYQLPLGLSGLGLTAPGIPGLPSAHYPGSLSPGALRQSYPRSLSPNSLLTASRYHPYKSAMSAMASPPSAAGLGAAIPPSLAAYFPYSLYGQRLGAT